MTPRTPKTAEHHEWAQLNVLPFEHFTPLQIIGAYNARYPDSYDFTREFEGGYVNDPDDPGGCTNMGITIGTLTAWRNDSTTNCDDVYNLSETEAGMIYATNYWSPVWGNKLPVGLNTQVWDFGVNAGPSRAVKTLQQIIGSPTDGIMGPNTLTATQEYIARTNLETLLTTYRNSRQSYYESLSTFSKYGNGWTRRNDECYDLSMELSLEGSVLPSPGEWDGSDNANEMHTLEARVTELERWRRS